MKRILILAFFTIVSCSTQERAEIVLKGDASEDKASMDSAYPRSGGSFKNYKLHEVLYTDTLASLAKHYNVSPHDIITLNSLTKPYYLEPGEIVKIPVYGESVSGLPSIPDSGETSYSNSGDVPNKNTIKILPSLPSEQLHDYDY
jgi:LysM repeat protein